MEDKYFSQFELYLFVFCLQDSKKVEVHADDGIVFQLLSGADDIVGENKFDASLLQATGGGGGEGQSPKDMAVSKLNKVHTLKHIQSRVFEHSNKSSILDTPYVYMYTLTLLIV